MNNDSKPSVSLQRIIDKMTVAGEVHYIEKGTEILREGQYVTVVPLVRKGLVKVFTRYEDRELLLYYIRPDESCIMSFAAGNNREPSQVYAVTEEDSELLLIPVTAIHALSHEHPFVNTFFFQQYKERYAELLDTIHHVLFSKMDVRLYKHLKEKVALKRENPLNMSHQQIANELGTVREVVSRIMKKLEGEGLVKQVGNAIEVL
ncbi:Crp/Fnr family transcriptional regulator [Robertkochia sediminum]|uniref:Crp/Fnr family transcriptional regulator n=1 Tax=Robertkochia sediminum TaxID=2785326 RepID=UPI0019345785|nr:Crp/Fnr family transcriptional regulator [Robertkochia sediminum]MBL7474095.1 Crp/Fnr family transcriptional regulator [Robertkochia sediminum]